MTDTLDSSSALSMATNPNQPMYIFPGAYGGMVQSPKPPMIHDLIREFRFRVTLDAAKAPGVMFPVKSAKALNQQVAQACADLNLVVGTVDQKVTVHETTAIPDNKNKSGTAPVFRTLTTITATVRIIAPDTSFHDFKGSCSGGDVDDKATGKADTGAWKNAILKGLGIPSEDLIDTDDEQQTQEPERKPAKVVAIRPDVKVPEAANAEEPASDREAAVSKALALIAAAKTVGELESVREEIRSGKVGVHGQDKFKISKPFTDKMSELTGKKDNE